LTGGALEVHDPQVKATGRWILRSKIMGKCSTTMQVSFFND